MAQLATHGLEFLVKSGRNSPLTSMSLQRTECFLGMVVCQGQITIVGTRTMRVCPGATQHSIGQDGISATSPFVSEC